MYRRFTEKNVYGIGANYVGRTGGIGIQFNLEWTHEWDERSYTTANYFYGTDFFPIHKLTGSYFTEFTDDYTTELGLQYIYLQDDTQLYTGLLGVSRFLGDFWLEGKASVVTNFDEYYGNLLARSRYFLEERTAFVTLLAATGSAPYDAQLDFQFNTFLDAVFTTVGAGYQDSWGDHLSFGVYGYWFHFQTDTDSFVNQYQMTLLLEIRF
jgi:YaiO family outer membrane protein